MRPRFLFWCLLSTTGLLGACAPNVNKSWLDTNCGRFPTFVPDRCEIYVNCQRVNATQCRCKNVNGTYIGEMRESKLHGGGTYLFSDGSRYDGYWWEGNRLCGVEKSGGKWLVWQRGKVTSKGDTADIGTALLGAALVGFVGYAAAQSGGSTGRYTYDYDWAWDGFYGQGGRWVWACRGIQTGRFAPAERCANKPLNDNRWPSTRP